MTNDTKTEATRLEQLLDAQKREAETIRSKTTQVDALRREIEAHQRSILIRSGRIDELQRLDVKDGDDG